MGRSVICPNRAARFFQLAPTSDCLIPARKSRDPLLGVRFCVRTHPCFFQRFDASPFKKERMANHCFVDSVLEVLKILWIEDINRRASFKTQFPAG